jgi:hypothetical protein
MEVAMSALSAETRRLLVLSRGGDDPSPASELAVRNRLVARLGVTALAGVAGASAALGAAEAGSAAAGAQGAAVGSTAGSALSSGATTAALAKTVATLVVVAGLGAGVWKSDDKVDAAAPWPAAAAAEVKHAVKRAWQIVTNADDEVDRARARSDAPDAITPPISAEAMHERLIAIARRPNRPVAKEVELVLILAAERALGEGDVARAERYLDRHRAQFSDGELSAEREALRVLCERARRGTNF